MEKPYQQQLPRSKRIKNHLTKSLLPLLIILLTSQFTIAQETKPEPTSDPNSHIQVVPSNTGKKDLQGNSFLVWETQCLKQPYEELSTVVTDKGDVVDKGQPEDSVTQTLENLESIIINKEWFDKLDISPFLESISNRNKMGLTEYKNKGYLAFMIVMLTLVLALIIIISIFTCTKLSKKVVKPRPRCIKCCLIFLIVFIVVMFALLIVNIAWTPRMMRIQKDLLCEATRLPHTLFFGSPEIHYKIETESKFLGIERIREYMFNFLKDYEQFTDGKDLKILQEIKDLKIQTEVNKLLITAADFKAKYREKKVLNSEGNFETPISVTHALPLYVLFLDSMLERYEMTSKRIDNINILTPILENKLQAASFKYEFEKAVAELEDIEVHLSTFWNDIMRSSFDSTLGFKLATIGLMLACLILWASVVATVIVLCKRTKHGKIQGKTKVRFLMILVLFLMIFALIAIFEVNRATFATVYGCATMHQFKHSATKTKPLIEKYLLKDSTILKMFNNCYFDPQPSGSVNFYNLFINLKSKDATESFLAFMDALKVVNEEIKGIKGESDTYQTTAFQTKIMAYKDGLSYDFTDSFRNLSTLNSNFNCSTIAYGLTEKTCFYLPQNKTKCISILKDNYEPNSCMGATKATESQALFDRLKTHIEAEQVYIDEMINDLMGTGNTDSILSKMDGVITKFDQVNAKIQTMDSDLGISFSDLESGHLEDWLDCRAIKKDIDTSHEKLCGHYIFQLIQYGDVTFFFLLLAFISILMVFILTFCLQEMPKYSNAFRTAEDLNNTDEFGEPYVRDEDDAVMIKEHSQEDTFEQFGTFKEHVPLKQNQLTHRNEPIKKSGQGPLQSERTKGKEGLDFSPYDESDDEDIFNQPNDFGFKK